MVMETPHAKCELQNVSYTYEDDVQALRGVNLCIYPNQITAILGPAGGGKSTLLRLLNRLNDLIPGRRLEGHVLLDGDDLYAPGVDVHALRRRVGMVFATPVPLPMSIRRNLTYGPELAGVGDRTRLDELVEHSLRAAALWDEVKDKPHSSALDLSAGEQQRLCIARVLAVKPEVILMDEPCSALDPAATLRIEDLMRELREHYTIVIVTHNMQQAARVSDYTGLFWLGELVEYDETGKIFTRPAQQLTEDYVTGRMG